jgi:hypothetical protein
VKGDNGFKRRYFSEDALKPLVSGVNVKNKTLQIRYL